MDMQGAIEACRKDLEKDPRNPRIAYQLARALTYSGNIKEGLPLIEKTVEQGYPQSLFVTGYLYLTGAYGAPKDDCRAGELMRESAVVGRLAGQVGFPKYYLDGRFKGCAVKQDPAEMIAFLEAAKASKPDYYPALLADELLRTFRARYPKESTK
jgi:TPR repeat protein